MDDIKNQMELSELKNTITKIKKPVDALKGRMEGTKE